MGGGASTATNTSLNNSSKRKNIIEYPKDVSPPGEYAKLRIDKFETSETQFRLLTQIKNKGYLKARRSPQQNLKKKTV